MRLARMFVIRASLFFNSVGVQAPTELNAPRGCARIRTGICLLKQTRIRRARLASESWLDC